jgi:hypothetical protein
MALLSLVQARVAFISILSVIVILAAINVFRPLNDLVLNYDEVDYMNATKPQFSEIYLGKSTLNFSEFLRLGYKKIKGGDSFPLSVQETKDGFLLRHFHGVLPVYFIKLFQKGEEDAIANQKAAWKAKLSLTVIFVISFLCLPLYYSNSSQSFLASFAVAALFLTTPIVLEPFYGLNFHTFLALAVIPFSIVFNMVNSNPDTRNSVLLLVILGLMVNIIVTASFIIFGVILVLFMGGKFKKVITGSSLLAFAATIFLTYPGQLLSFDFVKAHLMHAYKILVYKKEYTSVSVGSVFEDIQTLLPFILVLCAIFVYRHFFLGVRTSFKNDALLYIGVLFLFLNSPFLLNNRYFLPGITLLAVWAIKEAGLMFDGVKFNNIQVFRVFLLSLMVIVIFNFSVVRKNAVSQYLEESKYASLFRADIVDLKNSINSASNSGLIVSDIAHILKFYMESYEFVLGQIANSSILVRVDRENLPIDVFKKDHQISMFMFRKINFWRDINNYPILKKCNDLDSTEHIIIRINLCMPS